MRELLELTILSIDLNESNTLICFNTAKNRFVYGTYGDCCSESWIETLEGTENLLGNEVNSVEELEAYCEPGTRQESDMVYGYKVNTDKGTFKLIFRNSSNGCYGGWLELLPEAVSTENIVWTTHYYMEN